MLRNILGSFVLSLSTSMFGCAVQSGDDPGSAIESKPAVIAQAGAPKTGESCNSTGTSEASRVVLGTMDTNGFCCGYSKCDDPKTCGADYGKYHQACVSCKDTALVTCHPGPFIDVSAEGDGTGTKPGLNPQRVGDCCIPPPCGCRGCC